MIDEEELIAHLKRNEMMWQIWNENGLDSGTEFIVNFQFYSTKKKFTELLTHELSNNNIEHRISNTKTLLFLKGWNIEADIKSYWTLEELQEKTQKMFLMSQETGTSLEGCGAFIPK